MSAIIQDFASGAALVEGLHTFLLKGHTLRPSFTGTGNGYCDDAIGTTSSVQEVITLTFTSATDFSVVGSVSGAMGTGTAGSLFTHARFLCTIVVGTTAWVSGDTITWTMTAPWTALQYVAGQTYIYRAPGNDGNQEVNVGWTVKSNSTGGYYGVRVGAYPTVLPDGSFWQPWTKPWWPLGSYSGSAVRLFASVSGQAIWMTARIGSYYISAVAGYADIPGTLDQQPFPYIVGGAMSWASEPADTSASWLYSASQGGPLRISAKGYNTDNESYGGEALYVRTAWNKWGAVYHVTSNASTYEVQGNSYQLWGSSFDSSKLQPNLDGSFSAWPFDMIRMPDPLNALTGIGAMPDNYGNIPFAYRIPAYDASGNLLVAESILRSRSRTKMLVLQNGALSNYLNLFAVEMF
ncbi:MAG: hypothetical protein WC455_31020 [Dehalococcoidia bacterium]|jgi:hypothetical protein